MSAAFITKTKSSRQQLILLLAAAALLFAIALYALERYCASWIASELETRAAAAGVQLELEGLTLNLPALTAHAVNLSAVPLLSATVTDVRLAPDWEELRHGSLALAFSGNFYGGRLHGSAAWVRAAGAMKVTVSVDGAELSRHPLLAGNGITKGSLSAKLMFNDPTALSGTLVIDQLTKPSVTVWPFSNPKAKRLSIPAISAGRLAIATGRTSISPSSVRFSSSLGTAEGEIEWLAANRKLAITLALTPTDAALPLARSLWNIDWQPGKTYRLAFDSTARQPVTITPPQR
jgi:hypothetical protein